jgi:hypothetical protein
VTALSRHVVGNMPLPRRVQLRTDLCSSHWQSKLCASSTTSTRGSRFKQYSSIESVLIWRRRICIATRGIAQRRSCRRNRLDACAETLLRSFVFADIGIIMRGRTRHAFTPRCFITAIKLLPRSPRSWIVYPMTLRIIMRP